MPAQSLTDEQRGLIHDLALDARALLVREASELLEGVYGLHVDGTFESTKSLPQVRSDPETAETYHRLTQFLHDETQAGLEPDEVVEKLVKEVAFTHLNRLVAFKMMEARRLIRGTLDKGHESNAFKYYLADPDHANDLERYQHGDVDTAYRHFLLWQSAQVAEEIRVLFDPDNLPSRLFPRPRIVQELLGLLNRVELQPCWLADETIGWVYQFFNEEEKAQVFERLYRQKQKLRRQDIPAATQLFTPHWIVRFIAQNTLGRLWAQMHPDSRLIGTQLLDYLVPLQGEVPAEPLRPVKDITLLDPACGTMHFGLVAFDLFCAMYTEEIERAGEPGWPDAPSVSGPADIPAAVIEHNLYGIDIDLRAVQLSALALYLKAKSYNPKAYIMDSNLAVADVLPLNSARLGAFVREAKFTRPVYERVIRALWERLQDASDVGSLLRLEKEIRTLIDEERGRYAKTPLFAGLEGEFEAEANTEDFWDYLDAQIVQALDEFARQQAAQGVDLTFFSNEAVKGLRLLDVMLRRYDVVVTNPPYSGKRNLNDALAAYLDAEYPDSKGDLYTAFIERCAELVELGGRLGMITQQSFMFLSSYEKLRANLRGTFAIEAMAHVGPRAFAEISGEKVNTTVFALRTEPETPRREDNIGTYYRLVAAPEGDAKRTALEQALRDGSATYYVAQRRFDAIPGSPWVYWVPPGIFNIFTSNPQFTTVAQPKQGLATMDNFRFLHYWWESGYSRIGFGFTDAMSAKNSGNSWFPCMKGGPATRWFGNQEFVVRWNNDGLEMKTFVMERYGNWSKRISSADHYFQEGITWSTLSADRFSGRYMPSGFIFETKGSAAFTEFDKTAILEVANSRPFAQLFEYISPTLDFHEGYLARVPLPIKTNPQSKLASQAIHIAIYTQQFHENTYYFSIPLLWHSGVSLALLLQDRLVDIEKQIDEEVYHLYGISDEDRVVIESELAGCTLTEGEEEYEVPDTDENEEAADAPITREELAVRWVSYAIGVVLGRFQPGVGGALGRAVYCKDDFAVGSLPEPDEVEFDQLVGPPERFAYIDTAGGRHVFPAEVELALRSLALPDGIAVLDEGYPCDLPALVWQALVLMLGEDNAREVVAEGTGGDLRKFLERDFFTKWHFRWYRKRPVYWPLQSAKRSYGFVLFHERIDRSTLYVLQRDYLDAKLNGLHLYIQDIDARKAGLSGSALKQVEREIDRTTQMLDEVQEFAETMARIASEGYEPEPNWIDDGVILRMAPLWELIPIWKSEPRKYWERLQAGEYDWSHIAMRYWPGRVREKCKTNKSYAIAHGLEHLYGG